MPEVPNGTREMKSYPDFKIQNSRSRSSKREEEDSAFKVSKKKPPEKPRPRKASIAKHS